MNVSAKVGGRRVNGDPRDLRNWVGSLTLKATREGDQFMLAAVYAAMTGNNDQLADHIHREAKACLERHKENEKKKGMRAVIT